MANPACLLFERPPAAPDLPPAQYPTMAGPRILPRRAHHRHSPSSPHP
jgi:hypothetical protein